MDNRIVEMVFGSHLYGTATPKSDQDFKGVFLPDLADVLLQRVQGAVHSSTKQGTERNQPGDIDREMYSLQYFIHLACAGETVALDMLHAPRAMVLEAHDIWWDLVAKRELFYTKSLKAFVGYARKQAAKYGVKGSRISAVQLALQVLAAVPPETKIETIWGHLPEGEHIHKWWATADKKVLYLEHQLTTELMTQGDGIMPYCWEVCGKKLTLGSTCGHYLPMLQNYLNEYGARAKQAQANEGIDWKALSHAFRAAFQVQHILEDGGYTYPLPETEFLIAVKAGQLPYTTVVGPALDELITHLEQLSAQSNYPETVDRAYWDAWLVTTLKRAYGIP